MWAERRQCHNFKRPSDCIISLLCSAHSALFITLAPAGLALAGRTETFSSRRRRHIHQSYCTHTLAGSSTVSDTYTCAVTAAPSRRQSREAQRPARRANRAARPWERLRQMRLDVSSSEPLTTAYPLVSHSHELQWSPHVWHICRGSTQRTPSHAPAELLRSARWPRSVISLLAFRLVGLCCSSLANEETSVVVWATHAKPTQERIKNSEYNNTWNSGWLPHVRRSWYQLSS